MAVFELILCIIAAVVLSSFLSRFIPKVSTPLVQIALGALASQLPFFPDVTLSPELFMVLFIAPLLYLEAHEIDKSELLKSVKLSLSLAIGLAIATMAAVGFALHAVWPAIPLAAALALGAALGPTDAVAVSSLGKEAALTQRQTSVLKGESLFNDASGIVGFQFAIAAAVSGVFEVGESTMQFVASFFGGAFFGIVVGMVADIIGGVLAGYAINPLITLGAASIGLVGGLGWQKLSHLRTGSRLWCSVLAAHFVGSMVINSLALHIFYGYAWAVLIARIPNALVLTAVNTVLLRILLENRALMAVAKR